MDEIVGTTTTDDGAPEPAGAAADERLLSTTVVGSYSIPEWLGRFKTEFHRGRLSAAGLREIEDVAVRAAVLDQSLVGLDVISDGEIHRDNDMDSMIEAIDGVEVVGKSKQYYFDYLDAVVRAPLPDGGRADPGRIVADFLSLSALSDKTTTVSLPGPYSLTKRIHNEAYRDESDLLTAVARSLNQVLGALADAGATHLQLDEPFVAGYPEMIDKTIEAVNIATEGIAAHLALHVCYGNRYARPAWEGHYDFLLPAVADAHVDALVLEFARKGLDDLELLKKCPGDFRIGVGVVDVKSRDVEPVELIESRLYQALRILPPERIIVNPDCGLRHVPIRVARAKLDAMCRAADAVRADILGTRSPAHLGRTTAPGARDGVVDVRPPATRLQGVDRQGDVVARRFDVLGVGNAIVDMVAEVDHEVVDLLALQRGTMTLVDDETSERLTATAGWNRGMSGGSAANTTVGLVGLGGTAGFTARVADDLVGIAFAEDIREAGVHFVPARAADSNENSGTVAHPYTGPGSGRCLVLVTPDGERTMATYLGASILIEPAHLDASLFPDAQVVYLEGYLADAPAGEAVLREAAKLARAAGSHVALSLSDPLCVERHRSLFLELAEGADLLFANQAEAALLAGSSDDERVWPFLAALSTVSTVTRGAQGSIVVSASDRVVIDPPSVKSVVDTTGAGDLYAAGFLFGWTHGADLDVCGKLGALAAGEIVQVLGARSRRQLAGLVVEQGLHHTLTLPDLESWLPNGRRS